MTDCTAEPKTTVRVVINPDQDGEQVFLLALSTGGVDLLRSVMLYLSQYDVAKKSMFTLDDPWKTVYTPTHYD